MASTELMMPSNHLILCHPLLLPLIFPNIRVFSNESALHIRWPELEFQWGYKVCNSNAKKHLSEVVADWGFFLGKWEKVSNYMKRSVWEYIFLRWCFSDVSVHMNRLIILMQNVDSDSLGLGWGPSFFISNNSPRKGWFFWFGKHILFLVHCTLSLWKPFKARFAGYIGDPDLIPGRKIHWRMDRLPTPVFLGFPGGSDGKESSCNVGDLGLVPG